MTDMTNAWLLEKAGQIKERLMLQRTSAKRPGYDQDQHRSRTP